MANRSRKLLIQGDYHKPPTFTVPFVTTLHPAITVLTKITKSAFHEASEVDPMLSFLIPKPSPLVAYKRLPNLQLLLCKNDQNALVSTTP